MSLCRHAPFYTANNVSRLYHNESRGSNLSKFHLTVAAHCFCHRQKQVVVLRNPTVLCPVISSPRLMRGTLIMGYECINRLSLRSVSVVSWEKVVDGMGCPNHSSEVTSWYLKVYPLMSMNIDRRKKSRNRATLWL
jgi:hypothetical protein